MTKTQVAAILADQYGLVGGIEPLPGDRDQNLLISVSGGERMLKIANPAESRAVLETQQQVLDHLHRWDPQLPLPVAIPTLTGALVAATEVDGTAVLAKMTTFIPGETIEQVGWTRELRLDATAVLARLDLALRSFVPNAVGAPQLWQIDRLGELRPHLEHLAAERRPVVAGWLDFYDEAISGRLSSLRTQTIHGDFNPANLLTDPDYPERLNGVIDFGDMTIGALVADPAIAAAYQCLGSADPAGALAAAAASFNDQHPLTADEVAIFPLLAVSRLVQSLIISSWRATLHPENRSYILIHAEPIWDALTSIRVDEPERLVMKTEAACGVKASIRSTEETLSVRRARLSSGMRLSYDRPLRLRSGRGVWLTDSDGEQYLDAYNNVAHVGHGHPTVVAALARQASKLNTNTRYLIDEVGDFADRLASLLPAPLDTVFFANSGSEANDLAWRIARVVTGRRGMVVTRHAYHGSTQLTIDTSPEEIGLDRLPRWVQTVPAPAQSGTSEVDAAIDHLDDSGEPIAAFACDTVFSSDGIYTPPDGFLAATYETVRAHGGLCIADEVQAGYGRVGTRFWGFATDTAVPDIVTLGKPIGNGHPLAAVVTSREIAERFSSSSYYFSTFAGNPVSTVVGQAVLDVMEQEDLPAQADRIGAYIRSGLRLLVDDHHLSAKVRGPGLFIGLELCDEHGEPDPAGATWIHNEMRERQVLIGRTGISQNVLKIRPPLVFAERHADTLLARLDAVLSSR